MSKQTYWLHDPNGVYAQVEGADQRDLATRVYGWAEVDEPPTDGQVHVVNEHPEIAPGRLPYGALEGGGWAGRGWRPGPPPEMPAPTEQAASNNEPAKKSAASPAGEQKEK